MATEKNLNNLIINKVENQAVYDYMKINNLINADELYFISGADDNATETESGLMSAEDKIKLDGIQEGAEINQNAFSNVAIGSTTISADSKTDTLTLVAGSNVTITPDSTNDKIIIAATDTTYNAAGSSLGLVKSGGDVNISNGVITVNDNSHSHTIDNVDNLQSVLNGKVDAVDGKGLSTNDLTNTLKSNYDAAYTHSQQTHAPANAEKNVIVGIQKNGTDLSVNSSTRKVNITIPTKTSDLTNDSNFATTTALDTKVDKVNGKGLSTNDYTTAEKQKLANIANGANNYTLPVATSSTVGGIKSGTDITIDASGNVSVNDDSHNHIIGNVDGLQSALDGKSDTGHTHNNLVPTSRTVNGKALTSDISLTASDVGAISTTDGAVGTNNLASDAVQTGKIAAGAVTREKLAADALYSPLKTITADRNIEVDDLGKTLKPEYSSSSTTFTLTLNAVSSTSLPIGAEIAVCRLYDLNQVNIAFSGVRVIYLMGGRIANKDDNVAITVPRVGGMLAIKKMEIDTTYGDLWLVTGNVEVIS